MKGNKNISSIFDYCHETDSQEIYLQRCGFARPGEEPPDSDRPLNDGIATHRSSDDSETDRVIGSGYGDDVVESHAIRFVSPQKSAELDELEEDATDRTVEIVAEKQKDVPVESEDAADRPVEIVAEKQKYVPVESEDVDSFASGDLLLSDRDPSSSGNRRDERLESPGKEEDGRKKLKIPLRDVVKAIVMNSRKTGEEDKEIVNTSCVQILMNKGFKFPGM